MTDSVIHALKFFTDADYESGSEILEKYHYTMKTFWNKNVMPVMLCCALLVSILAVRLFCFLKKSRAVQQARIEEMTDYLKATNVGRESVLTRHEDVFFEDELYKTVTELRKSREAALEERKLLSENLADVAHQLKTPLTSMSLMTQLLMGHCEGSEKDYAERLNRQLDRLGQLVSSLLILSRLDAGTIVLEKSESLQMRYWQEP